MKKIGKCIAICFVAALFIDGFSLKVAAQNDISVTATVSESTIYAGQQLQLDITVSGDFSDVSRPALPDFSDFRLVSSIPSTSRNLSYVNGVSKASYTYSYNLVAQQTGTFTIPAISITVNGQPYQTQPITVEVIKRNNGATKDNSQPDIFLRMNITDNSAVPGQQIIANVVLYFKDNLQVNSYQPIPGWKAEGFWKEQLESPGPPQVNSTIIDGVRFNKAQLLQFALFPAKAGELIISAYDVRVSVRSVRSRGDPFSSFFGSFGSNQKRLELETKPVTINVDPLPDSSGLNYIGAVGSFTIDRNINTDSASVGESIEIITRISGTGNIPLLTKPEYNFPNGLELYQPQTNVDIDRQTQQIGGTKTFTDVVVPRNPGRFTIPQTTIAYYNASRGEYITETLPSETIVVRSNPNVTASSDNSNQLLTNPITGLANWVSPAQKSLAGYWWFWAGLLFPLIGLALGYWRKTYRKKMSSNFIFARSQKAAETANRRLQQAIDHAENDHLKLAYNSLEKGLTGFIGDRLGLPEAGISIEQYIETLEEHHVNNELIKNTRMLLNKCATINYAPDSSHDYLKSHVGLAKSIIDKLKKEL